MDQERNRLRLLYLLYLRRKKREIKRRFWIHDIIKARYVEGEFYTLFEKLQKDPDKFFNYFRMSEKTFNYILWNICSAVQKKDTYFRECIPPKEMLAITLRYLASGRSFTDLHYSYRIGIATISRIVQATCSTIWEILESKHFPKAIQGNWLDISANFAKFAHFPRCLGAIDGKHVRIINFPHEGSMNFNYKKHHSIILLAVADSDYKFTYVNIGGYGKDCDSNILQQTEFWSLMCNRKLNIPDPAPLPPEGIKVPYVFVADDAFPMHEHIMRNYGGHNLTTKQRIFNYRLCKARKYVECAFGILTNKWRIFYTPLNLSKVNAIKVVKASVVLHNIVRDMDGYRPEDLLTCPLKPVAQNNTEAPKHSGRGTRTCFANFFMSAEGSLPWQLTKI